MASWRDTTPQAVQDDLDGIVGLALDAALNLLTKNGEFYPFGVTVSDEGQAALTSPEMGSEHPRSTAVLAAVTESLRQRRDAYRAIGLVAAVTTTGGDAVRVEVEHRDGGPAITVLVPYVTKGLLRKSVSYGDAQASEGERQVWR
jgi:hypothetical protein